MLTISLNFFVRFQVYAFSAPCLRSHAPVYMPNGYYDSINVMKVGHKYLAPKVMARRTNVRLWVSV